MYVCYVHEIDLFREVEQTIFLKKVDILKMCGIIFVYTLICETFWRHKMKEKILIILAVIAMQAGCVFALKGLDVKSADTEIKVESLETSKDE